MDAIQEIGLEIPSRTRRRIRTLRSAWTELYQARGNEIRPDFLAFQRWANDVLRDGAVSQAFADRELARWQQKYEAVYKSSKGKTGKAPTPEPPAFPIDWEKVAITVGIVAGLVTIFGYFSKR